MNKIKPIIALFRKHAPTILTGISCVGVVLTGYLTHKVSSKKSIECEIYNKRQNWKDYILPITAGAGTIACIIGANYIHLSREAALSAALAFYKALGNDIQDAVETKFGTEGLMETKTAMAEAPFSYGDPSRKIKIWEPYTKQWFEATTEQILWAELTANKMLHQGGTVTLNDVLKLYSGCKMKPYGEMIGWSWNDESFEELSCYYYAGGWIDMCPQWTEEDGKQMFIMEYGIHPSDLTDIVNFNSN